MGKTDSTALNMRLIFSIMVMMSLYKTQKAFTLVELLIAIAVIGILATIATLSYRGIQDRASAAAIATDLQGVSKNLELDRIHSDSVHYNREMLAKYITTESSNSTVNFVHGSKDYFCIEGIGTRKATQIFHIDTRDSNTEIQEGPCPEGSGSATTRCVVGNIAVSVRQTNDTGEPLEITSRFHGTSTSAVSPGGQHSYASNLRTPSVEAGVAEVHMRGQGDSDYYDLRFYAHQAQNCD